MSRGALRFNGAYRIIRRSGYVGCLIDRFDPITIHVPTSVYRKSNAAGSALTLMPVCTYTSAIKQSATYTNPRMQGSLSANFRELLA